ncbi:L,D-transpeptidase family protein [Bacillus sp. RG28]|uniref:L,D-transpeptidase family protein n=1 Tax=Gottfriedia endophytica TaxID=2820819 RepID=A0A940SFX1_9BACI|nr:L,D-transpeptidase family protein [Gottfriedia endophytica]MBP0724457.1 L,D-transpeptidase family protein [Gottfriedia endophytica]
MIKRVFVMFVCLFLLFFGLGTTHSYAATNQLIVINKTTNNLAFYENGKLVKVFKVATGRKGSYTPEGNFKIVNKIVNRPFYKEHIPGGDPRNPLGKRWLGLNARGTWGDTYGIHGNSNASSIGKHISHGCIRMYNNQIEWLFPQVKINTPVIITSSKKSFDTIALASGYKVTKQTNGPVTPEEPNSNILKKGSHGSAVTLLQSKLIAQGYVIKDEKGIFGTSTENAVRNFQKDRRLSVDGIVGPATKKALGIN